MPCVPDHLVCRIARGDVVRPLDERAVVLKAEPIVYHRMSMVVRLGDLPVATRA